MTRAFRFDGWLNAVTGLGTILGDKMQSYLFQSRGRVDDAQLASLYEEDGLAAKVADSTPEHMFRRGWEITTPDNPQHGLDLKKQLEALEFTRKLVDAKVWERVFGGSALVLGFDDGRPVDQPLDETNLRRLLFVNVLEKKHIIPAYWYADPNKEKFGEVAQYHLTYFLGGAPQPGEAPKVGMQLLVHESRLVVFRGGRATREGMARNNGWGTSVLSKCYNELRGYNATWQAVENMIQDASQGVFKVKNLASIISKGNMQALIDRVKLVNFGRSVANAIIVDADQEEFERRDTTMSGLPDLIDRAMVRLSGVAKTPVTVLAGVSPAGLNATGESDMRNWYDEVESDRTQTVVPKLERVVRLTALCKEGPTGGVVPDNLSLKFPSLWQLTDLERAQQSATQTQSDTALIQAGVIIPEEVRARRAEELKVDADSAVAAIEAYNKQLATGEGLVDNESDPSATGSEVQKQEETGSEQAPRTSGPVSPPVGGKVPEGSPEAS